MMKRTIAMLLCAVLIFGLAACGEAVPEQVKAANNLIAAIGTVTLDSGEAIAAAENACAALSAEDLAQVQGYDQLQKARRDYDALWAKTAETAIAAIGTVTLTSADAINAAQVALDRLTEAQRALVSNAEALELAKQAYFDVQVADIEAAINAIGKVTLDSEGAINEAWAVYNRYDSDIQAAVSNFAVLEQAETALFMVRVQAVEAAISAIGEVNLDSAEKIDAARAAFDNSSAEVQAAVSNRSDLTDAEAAFQDLRVAAVVDAIDAIGEVSLDSGEAIEAARTAYDNLPGDLQLKVQNLSVLTRAEYSFSTLKAEARQQEIDAALEGLVVQVDYQRAIRWYYAPSEPYYADERSFALPYIGADASNVWLRLKYHYTGTEWVFFEEVTITVDGTAYEKEFEYFDIQRDNDAEVWEWVDFQPTEDDLAMLRAIAASKQTVVRFEGASHFFEFTMSGSDKEGITQVLDAYEILTAEE